MKLFLVIPSLRQGGAERVASELANGVAGLPGVSVSLVILSDSKDFYELNESVVVHRLGFRSSGLLSKLKSEIVTFFKLRILLKKHKPDAVLSFMEKYNVFSLMASSFLGLKVFVSDRSSPKKKLPLIVSFLRESLYPYAAGVIAQTELSKRIASEVIRNDNIQVIPNPVREVRLYPGVEREKIILNVGRLVPEKGQKYLLEAFSKIETPDWRLVILGDGPLRAPLLEYSEALGISDRIVMPGSVDDVDKWLGKASIFAFTSVSEGFPNALAEAMAAGLPCISFDCDAGPRDIIENGVNGLLVKTKDVDAFSIKLKTLIEDSSLRDSLSSEAALIREKLDRSSIMNRYVNFLAEK